MTAEMGMINKHAVALAADSAVTVRQKNGDSKVYNSANKLFQLSRYEPIGIMVYGSASFMGIPWETIIKLYTKKLKNKKFNYVLEYSKDFIKFLERINIPSENEDEFIKFKFYSFVENYIIDLQKYNKKLAPWINETDNILNQNYPQIIKFSFFIKSHYKKKYYDFFKEYLEKLNDEYREYDIIESNDIDSLINNLSDLFFKYLESSFLESVSGIVIAGFGDKEIYPSLESFEIEGKIGKSLIIEKRTKINISNTHYADVIPFAQTDTIKTFIYGINPILERNTNDELESKSLQLVNGISQTLRENLGLDDEAIENIDNQLHSVVKNNFLKQYYSYLADYKSQNHTMPILKTVAQLQKEDLGAMAESLVNIASIDKKMTMELESVGGPIDVAIISKGDGFIWYKRKHYFKQELNPDFIMKKRK